MRDAALKAALVSLGLYVLRHEHCRLWVHAITLILERKGLPDA
jgi:hypothetical protein